VGFDDLSDRDEVRNVPEASALLTKEEFAA
jgi:hypothetical protein